MRPKSGLMLEEEEEEAVVVVMDSIDGAHEGLVVYF